MKWLLTSAFVALAVLANWLASRFTITVPLTSLVAPAGVLCIGADRVPGREARMNDRSAAQGLP